MHTETIGLVKISRVLVRFQVFKKIFFLNINTINIGILTKKAKIILKYKYIFLIYKVFIIKN